MLNSYPSAYEWSFFTLNDNGLNSVVAYISSPHPGWYPTNWRYSYNTWNHIAYVYNIVDGTLKFYNNGNLLGTHSVSKEPLIFPSSSKKL